MQSSLSGSVWLYGQKIFAWHQWALELAPNDYPISSLFLLPQPLGWCPGSRLTLWEPGSLCQHPYMTFLPFVYVIKVKLAPMPCRWSSSVREVQATTLPWIPLGLQQGQVFRCLDYCYLQGHMEQNSYLWGCGQLQGKEDQAWQRGQGILFSIMVFTLPCWLGFHLIRQVSGLAPLSYLLTLMEHTPILLHCWGTDGSVPWFNDFWSTGRVLCSRCMWSCGWGMRGLCGQCGHMCACDFFPLLSPLADTV